MSSRQLFSELTEPNNSYDLLKQIVMTLDETLKLLRIKEKESGSLLKDALSLKRNCVSSTFYFLRNSDAVSLLAVNSKARIKWGTTFIREIFDFFGIGNDKDGPTTPFFLITIADKYHLTTDQSQQVNLPRIKRKLGVGLMGLSYIGMIEPGYYNVIYDELVNQRKNIVSWHGHFLVWGVSEEGFAEEAAFRTATRVDPEFAQAWYNLGDLLDDQGRPVAAIECLRKALRVAPNYADAMFNLALLRQRKNQYADAADSWRRYLAHDGHSEWATRARRCLKFCEMQGYLIASA
jgi:hypothetical protein